MPLADDPISWVVLTMGNRHEALGCALSSLLGAQTTLVCNGCEPPSTEGVSLLVLPRNEGVPGGRDRGVEHTSAPIIGFLDDDAVAPVGISDAVVEEFAQDPQLGAVSFRLVDEEGATSRRHVPRIGGGGVGESGDVALFLGGASAIRRTAYEQVGGYFTELFYGHEELEISWRLIDAGWRIRYLADIEVFHPRTQISRHKDGWQLTGRNRVLIARRTLPAAVAALHVLIWLLLGSIRSARQRALRSYLAGWREGWTHPVDRRPISWRGVWRLTRLGRPPIV